MNKQLSYIIVYIFCLSILTSITFKVSAQVSTEKIDTITENKIDINIITIPFKIRTETKGQPIQLNTNFSTALYLGKRKEMEKAEFGYGILIGIGAVTMNPYVTELKITEEYDGFVSSIGLACLYNAGRFNLGLASGIDHLMDKNRQKWIYQHKIWFGVLFGINLN